LLDEGVRTDAKIINFSKNIENTEQMLLNRTIKSWNQLPAGLLASFPCKINTFIKRVKKAVTSKGIQLGD